ncbi:MAG: hypothetical protein K6F70_08375 [Eggerthellaceae bacterium]|nr:hypothetical protein [Eggerthellaceae bacterium]
MSQVLDYRLDAEGARLLSSLVGQLLEAYRCDTFTFSNSVYGTLGLIAGGKAFELTNYTESEPGYFGYTEEVSRFKLRQVDAADLKSGVVDGEQIDHVVNDVIRGVELVNDRELMLRDGEVLFDYRFTRAIIFKFDGHELAFERGDDIFELIHIVMGPDALQKIGPVDEFESPMEGCVERFEREVIPVVPEKKFC